MYLVHYHNAGERKDCSRPPLLLVTSVRLKSLQTNTMRRGELQGVSKVVLLRKGEKDALNQFLTFPAFRNTTTSTTRKEGRDPDDWQPRVQAKKKVEVAGWFYPTQRALLYLQIRLLSNQSLWWIIFNILKRWNLTRGDGRVRRIFLSSPFL